MSTADLRFMKMYKNGKAKDSILTIDDIPGAQPKVHIRDKHTRVNDYSKMYNRTPADERISVEKELQDLKNKIKTMDNSFNKLSQITHDKQKKHIPNLKQNDELNYLLNPSYEPPLDN